MVPPASSALAAAAKGASTPESVTKRLDFDAGLPSTSGAEPVDDPSSAMGTPWEVVAPQATPFQWASTAASTSASSALHFPPAGPSSWGSAPMTDRESGTETGNTKLFKRYS